MINRLAAFICLLLSMGTIASSQSIDSLLELYNSRVPQEKVHIHFDNSLYTPGQTIWYKAYLLKGMEPSGMSKNFYIDWFDTNGKLVNRTIAPVIGSCASGSFTVPEKYSGNRLQVLAYTKWMLNFDSAFLFHKTLTIAQPGLVQNDQPAIVPVTTLRFFPEGGDMIENIPTNIAFKAQNTAGRPMAVTGVINNMSGQVVTRFTSLHNGMGKIRLTPSPGEVYTAEWKDALGNTQHTQLPSAKPSGIVLTLNNHFARKRFTIARSAKAEDRFKKPSIVVHMNQQVVFRAVVNLADKETITADLPTHNFPSGVLQVTVFDAYRQPMAERIVFVNNEEYRLQANVYVDTLNLEKRGKNVYEIEIPDSIVTSLSLAVTDGAIGHDTTGNIISQLLLSDEIKGYVYNPAYYFSSAEDSVAEHLDLVMLTNGWRRFRWEDVWSGKTPSLIYQPDTSYLSIAGKIDKLSESRIKKAELVNLVLMAKDSSTQFIFAPLMPDGSFRADNLILFDTIKVFYKLNQTFIPGRSQITINNTFLSADNSRSLRSLVTFLADTSGMARIKAFADEQKRVEALMKLVTLKEVIVKARIKSRLEEMNERYASGLFRDRDAYQFNIIDDPFRQSYNTVFGYLQGKVPGLEIRDPYSANPSATWRRSPASFFLDEFPVDVFVVSSLSLNQIAYVKVFRPPFSAGFGGQSGGAIALYTKQGDDIKTMFSRLDHTLLPGYTPAREFYSPNYAEKQNTFFETDLRQTIYWEPNIQTEGENRKVKISFYNNDISKSLLLVLEGLAFDGRLIHYRKLLK